MNPDSFLKMLLAGSVILILLETLVIATCFGLWLYALVHCIRHRHDSVRLMWVLLVCFLGPLEGPAGSAAAGAVS